MSNTGHRTTIIAVCGKGGVGKTSLSAIIAMLLAERGGKVLAIDADPAKGLESALGFEAHTTVDDIRNSLISRVKEGKSGGREETASMLDYEVFSAIVERGNIGFLAIGRPEKEGCYCQVNGMLKDIIQATASGFDFVVIDGEAGIEQVNRRVLEKVTHLLLVSDASARGINVARTIREVSGKAVSFEKALIILNRIRDADELSGIYLPGGLEFIGWVPEDDSLRDLDIRGRPILEMRNTASLEAVRKALDRMHLN